MNAISFTMDEQDRHGVLTRLVLAGRADAALLGVFGLPPLAFHDPLHRFGTMDPLCGMTRATRYLATGDMLQAWR